MQEYNNTNKRSQKTSFGYNDFMTIVGIDPGIGRVGWGVIQVQSAKCKAQNYGCFETTPKSDTADRLCRIYDFVSSLLAEHTPDALAIEELFFNTNVTTAFAVGQARGVILLAAAKHNVPVTSYTPLQVKMALTGYGRAEKSQIGQMVKMLLKLEKIPKLDDTNDALAIAITHAFSYKINSLK